MSARHARQAWRVGEPTQGIKAETVRQADHQPIELERAERETHAGAFEHQTVDLAMLEPARPHLHHKVAQRERSRDEDALRRHVDGGVSLIFTTGGTGVSARDVTPEATRAVLDREIPGFGELMRARGRESTLLASLSRSLAGTRGQVLIVNLPGSPKGAVESLDAIVELVPHVLELLKGRTEHSPA